MKLNKVSMHLFRRFENAVLYLDRKVVALVGPNEAGKTSVIDALSSLESQEELPGEDLTRGTKADDAEVIIEARYELEAEDRALTEQVGGRGDPRWFVIAKQRGGEVSYRVEPKVMRPSLQYREKGAVRIGRALADDDLAGLFKRAITEGKREGADRMPLGQRLRTLLKFLDAKIERLPHQGRTALRSVEDGISGLLKSSLAPNEIETLDELSEVVASIMEVEESPHPQELLVEELESKRPKFRQFGTADRTLKSEYPGSVVGNPPRALRNLLDLAGVEPSRLAAAYSGQDHGERFSLAQQANRQLRDRFARSWSQSRVTVELQFDEDAIRIHVKTATGFRPIAERSDGLRTFVALLAFAHINRETGPLVLLIDEAEAHLHYDAQADLVRVFYAQEAATQIVYSTHSAGCLPSDLGTDIRVVEPIIAADGSETDRSKIRSDFWSSGAGFSPLMLAMGASVFALSPCRFAILAEGPSDTVLLPTLFREATGLDSLPFQVAPGLANVARRDAEKLSLEAPKVAYFFDGDKAGHNKAKLLKSAGVEPANIVILSKGRVLEDLVEKRLYFEIVAEELKMSHGTSLGLNITDLPLTGRPSGLADWCRKKGIDPPSKVRIAQRLTDRVRQGEVPTLLTRSGATQLREAYKELVDALGLARPHDPA